MAIDRNFARRLTRAAVFALIRGAATAAGTAVIAAIICWIKSW
jgi:hypothetical protein